MGELLMSWHQRFTSITLLAMNIPVISQKLEGGHAPGWQDVQPHDPQVQDAANHAVKSLQQKSNSLFPYELQEIVHAKAENASPEKSKGGKDVETVEAGPSSSKDASSKKSTCGNDAETSGAGPLSKDVSPQTDARGVNDAESSGAGPSLSKVAYVENDPSGGSEVETSGPVPSSLSKVFLPCPNLEAMSRTLQSKDDLPSMFFL
ncbi:uncharacterized protein LOC133718687 [Rosa rugosa]|uniref:uncharacterized protein LOC133718687 n=1 Tax=Rosa rugosa TaxID=74645 RepID=UPI002B403357|nr:uncharacterized protein LOC133718687 [Rosa rugosa]XP_062001536.1 uncharacterized protein LOC133718687 [Rosa rugosa]